MSQTEEKHDSVEDTEAGFITHLLELRDRLLRVIIFLVIIFVCLFPFANQIYNFLAGPLLAHLPDGSSMIAVEVISPFLTPLKMALYAALIIGMPYLLYQAWSFVAPGLYKKEKRLAMPLLISSVILFYAGVAFAYYVVFPLVFAFLVSVAPEGVSVMTDINKYLDFVLAMFFAFGLAFEVPVATIILIAMGVTDANSLIEKRPYIIVGAFVIGMLLTPPDIISQVMLALPMWALFEVGIIMSRILIIPSEDEEDDEFNEAKSPVNTPAPAVATAAAAASSGTQSASQPHNDAPVSDKQANDEPDKTAAQNDGGSEDKTDSHALDETNTQHADKDGNRS